MQVETFCENLRHVMMAVSWGGHESLIIPRCAGMARGDFDPRNKEHRMIRLYAGLEEPNYIIQDLERGFESLP
jgi:cystathionine beta-lyase/cystathionine gamma-synthase